MQHDVLWVYTFFSMPVGCGVLATNFCAAEVVFLNVTALVVFSCDDAVFGIDSYAEPLL